MSTISEVVQANFKLTAELRQVRNELETLKAVKAMEDAEEVLRIKSAYAELEAEVVTLRKASLTPRQETFSLALGDTDSLSVIAMLSDQLERERKKFSNLEQRYQDLRKDLTCEVSTSAGSPYYLSIERTERVCIHDVFVPTLRRPVKVCEDPTVTPIVVTRAPPPPKRASDGAVSRLAKIARFKPS
jgi:hypothetical protein